MSDLTRKASKEAYERVIQEGLLGKRSMQIYRLLYLHPGSTANEICQYINAENPDAKPAQLNSISTRCSELERRQVLREIGLKVCTVSSHQATAYELTDNLPLKLTQVKKKTSNQKLYQNRWDTAHNALEMVQLVLRRLCSEARGVVETSLSCQQHVEAACRSVTQTLQLYELETGRPLNPPQEMKEAA
jgi:hypothetical protein